MTFSFKYQYISRFPMGNILVKSSYSKSVSENYTDKKSTPCHCSKVRFSKSNKNHHTRHTHLKLYTIMETTQGSRLIMSLTLQLVLLLMLGDFSFHFSSYLWLPAFHFLGLTPLSEIKRLINNALICFSAQSS